MIYISTVPLGMYSCSVLPICATVFREQCLPSERSEMQLPCTHRNNYKNAEVISYITEKLKGFKTLQTKNEKIKKAASLRSHPCLVLQILRAPRNYQGSIYRLTQAVFHHCSSQPLFQSEIPTTSLTLGVLSHPKPLSV